MTSILTSGAAATVARPAIWLFVLATLTAGCAMDARAPANGAPASGFVDMNMDRAGGGAGGAGGGSCG